MREWSRRPNSPAKEFSLIGAPLPDPVIAFTADSKTLVSASTERKVLFWDGSPGETFRTLTVPEGFSGVWRWTLKGRWLAVSPMSNVGQKHPGIRLFRFRERQAVGKLVGHTDRVATGLPQGRSDAAEYRLRRLDPMLGHPEAQEGKPLRPGGPRLDSLNVWEDGR